jgi:hypothetical protein
MGTVRVPISGLIRDYDLKMGTPTRRLLIFTRPDPLIFVVDCHVSQVVSLWCRSSLHTRILIEKNLELVRSIGSIAGYILERPRWIANA